jgi:hypothetical protein
MLYIHCKKSGTIRAFVRFMHRQNCSHGYYRNGVPHKLAGSRADWWPARWRRPARRWRRGSRFRRRGIQDHPIRRAFRNHLVLAAHAKQQRPARALYDQFPRADHANLSDGWLVGIRTNARVCKMQRKRFGIRRGKCRRPRSQRRGWVGIIAGQYCSAGARQQKARCACTNLNATRRLSAQLVSAKHRAADRSRSHSHLRAVRKHHDPQLRRRRRRCRRHQRRAQHRY